MSLLPLHPSLKPSRLAAAGQQHAGQLWTVMIRLVHCRQDSSNDGVTRCRKHEGCHGYKPEINTHRQAPGVYLDSEELLPEIPRESICPYGYDRSHSTLSNLTSHSISGCSWIPLSIWIFNLYMVTLKHGLGVTI